MRYGLLYLSTLLIMVPLDFLFLGVLAKSFFQSQIGHVMGEPNFTAAIVFYLIYAAGIVVFVNGSAGTSWQQCALFGALFGLFCYGTFELTSMAVIRDWTWKMVLVDMSWGAFVTAFTATVGMLLGNFAARQI